MVKTYDPKKVSVIIGTHIASGFADGDFITVERDEDVWSTLTGADGETTRAKNANKSGKFTLRLLAASASNDVLSTLQLADEASGGGTFAVMVKDGSGRSLYAAAAAWISKAPSAAFGKEAGTREWVIATDELVPFAGGN